jgi:hypothetical protein
MKTGSSFGTTLAHTANASLPQEAHIPSGHDKDDPEDIPARKDNLKKLHLLSDFFTYKYPVQHWFRGIFRNPSNPGQHVPIMDDEADAWNGFWVGVFRRPEDRVRSAWHNFAEGKGDIAAFQKNVQGQQTSMLSLGEKALPRMKCEIDGGGQNGPAPSCGASPEPDLRLALDRLKNFAFVGVLTEYQYAVCLFHVMFRSECFPAEFSNVDPTNYNETEEERDQEMKKLSQNPDKFDHVVYQAALSRFKGDLHQYNVTNEVCTKICPGGRFGPRYI